MMNQMQWAIIKKDFKTISHNKRLFPVLWLVPLIFVVVLPTIFTITIYVSPLDSSDFKQLLALIPNLDTSLDIRADALSFIFNSLFPVFFIMIPIMSASVMAASSFVGEKEKKTLETLLYCPLSLIEIFKAKIYASLLLSLVITFLSFLIMLLVVQMELVFLFQTTLSLDIVNWFIILVFVTPSISLLSITLIVNGSAKAQSVEESQQRAIYLILPILLVFIGQFTGILLLNSFLLLMLTAIFMILAYLAIRKAKRKFSYETLLQT